MCFKCKKTLYKCKREEKHLKNFSEKCIIKVGGLQTFYARPNHILSEGFNDVSFG